MKQDDLNPRPYNPDEDIDYDKEKVITTPHGAKVVVPLEGIIKWQKRHYEREIGELKSYIAELEDKNKELTSKQNNHENQVAQLKEKIRGLKAEVRDNPYYHDKVVKLQEKATKLQKLIHRLRKTNNELVSKLLSHGIEATVFEIPEEDVENQQ